MLLVGQGRLSCTRLNPGRRELCPRPTLRSKLCLANNELEASRQQVTLLSSETLTP